jgi:hypothetical protein
MVRVENLGQGPVNLPDNSGGHGKVRPVTQVEKINSTRQPADEHASRDQESKAAIQRNDFGDTVELTAQKREEDTTDSPKTDQS